MTEEEVLPAGSSFFGLVRVPPRLYKRFSQEDHAQGLVRRGAIRIGTLYEFRKTDGWDDLRGDGGEGTFRASLTSEVPETISEAAPPPLKDFIRKIGFPILSQGGTLNLNTSSPNMYMYCTLGRLSDQNAGYGSFVVEIFDVRRFFSTLTVHLTDELGIADTIPHPFAAPCQYEERTLHATKADQLQEAPGYIPFIKPRALAAEAEVRAIWHSSEQPLAAKITECQRLSRCCRYLGETAL